jgi:hypothetical protein
MEKIRKIGIDARFFGPEDKGLGRYSENLIGNLEKIDQKNRYFIFFQKNRFADYEPKNPNFKKDLFENLSKYELDLMHFTYFKMPFFYGGKFIVTVHDLTTSHVGIFKKMAYAIILRNALKKAKGIIAVSETTKKEILKKYHINPAKIKTIYEGVS